MKLDVVYQIQIHILQINGGIEIVPLSKFPLKWFS